MRANCICNIAWREVRIVNEEDLKALEAAVQLLETPGLAARLTDMVGKPIELIGKAMPASVSQEITAAALKAIKLALKAALLTMRRKPKAASKLLHKALATATGAAGGAFGLPALPVELPISTLIMFRSIADIARSEGENLSAPETALSCVEVFALGGRAGSTDPSQSGYFVVRTALAKSVTEAAKYVAERGAIEEGAPALVRFLTQVGARFGLTLGEKVAAQAVPVLGALGGGAVNYVFIEHFQAMAQGHFTVRRLERKYGKSYVRTEYDRLCKKRTSGEA
jgi:hypothetical protein